MIHVSDFLLGLTDQMQENARITVSLANAFLENVAKAGIMIPSPLTTSMWRPARYTHIIAPGSKPTSKHCTCQAIDLNDPAGELATWALDNLDVMERLGLWIEDPTKTIGWLHLQTVPPASGKRVFLP